MRPLRALLVLLSSLAVAGSALVGAAPPAAAAGFSLLNGGGSTWSEVALAQWAADVRRSGLVVNYEGVGSTRGRSQFAQGQFDFGVTEIPYQSRPDGPNSVPESITRKFEYMPIVAGGTSFMYNLRLGNQQITDLRLSPATVAKIFTGAITRWNDPQIVREHGKPLPAKRIIPVVRSDGSGTTAQFTDYMAKEQSGTWNDFCRRAGRATPCPLTSFYPATVPGFTVKTGNGSNGVASYVASGYGDGTITYVEYAYARQKRLPVVKLLNAAGYYVLPTAANVAVALTRAQLNPDRTQVLTGVYRNPDPRAYPLSSYSYMLVPTAEEYDFTAREGRSLSTFANYFLCAGQQKADVLGYSPLPRNLVQAGFDVVRRIPGAVPANVDLARCGNPTFRGGRNVLLETAPQPPACDAARSAPCGSAAAGAGGGAPGGRGAASPGGGSAGPGAAGAPAGGGAGGGGPAAGGAGGGGAGGAGAGGAGAPGGGGPAGGAPGSAAAPGTAAGAGGAGGGGPAGAPGAAPAAGGPPQIDPETGQPLAAAGAGGAVAGQAFSAVPVSVGAVREESGLGRVLYGLVALELLLVVLAPPLVGRALRRRREAGSGRT